MSEPEVRTWALIGLNDELKGQQFEITRRTSIGRSIASDIFLPDPSIGRHHCQIERNDDAYDIFPTSRTATFVHNGNVVRQTTLALGDHIEIGRFRLRVVAANAGGDVLAAEDPARDRKPIAASVSGMQTIVWGARVAVSADNDAPDEFVERSERLFGQMQDMVSREGGLLVQGDWPCRYAVWSCEPGEVFGRWKSTLRMMLTLEQQAFLHQGECTDLSLRQGIEYGNCFQWNSASGPVFGGQAVDECLRLTLAANPGQLLLGGRPHPATSAESIVESELPVKVWSRFHALWQESEGRRSKLELAERIHLSRFGLQLDGMALRAMHDPETQKLTLTVQCHAPLELESEYVISKGRGKPMTMVCSTCRQGPERSVQAQFTSLGPMEELNDMLGFLATPKYQRPESQAA